jgi:hypothetical protein
MTTLSHKKLVERARKNWDKASKVLCDWAIANGHGHVKHFALRELVPAQLWQADKDAHKAWRDAEDVAVAAGKAWRGTFGMLSWYR